MDLKETEILGSDAGEHWYYRSKAAATARFLSGRQFDTVLDVGAGSGFFSKHLLRHSSVRQAWCVDTSYVFDSDTTEAGKPVHYRRSVEHVAADLVLLMDVLEHVDEDVRMLADYIDKVNEGAWFLISVPAFTFLWSGHDDFLEHRRRYTLNQIERVARSAGLEVQRSSYYFGAVFPIAAAIRLSQKALRRQNQPPRSQLSKHSPLVNTILTTVCSLELPAMRANRLAGLTAFCLARKS